jgi:hypothetical protein
MDSSLILILIMNNLLQLAVALMVDLGLNNAPNSNERSKLFIATHKAAHTAHADYLGMKARTIEERRAVAGCWLLVAGCWLLVAST